MFSLGYPITEIKKLSLLQGAAFCFCTNGIYADKETILVQIFVLLLS